MKNLLVILALCCALTPLYAQDNDALWNSALAQLDGARKWAAAEVEMVSDIEKGGARQHVVTTMRLRGWEKGRPVYELVRREPEDKSASAHDFDSVARLLDVAEKLSESRPVRTDGQSLDGTPCALFEIRQDSALQKGTVKLWVDAGSGALRQMVVALRAPFMLDATVTVRYSAGPEGQPLPHTLDYVLETLVPFKHGKGRARQTNRTWITRPAA